MDDWFLLAVLTLDATLRVATPLVLCAMAGLFSERSAVTGSAWLGLGAAILTAMGLAMLHGFACITHRGNHVVSGVAINILMSGLTVTLGIAWFARGGQTPSLPNEARFTAITWPGTELLAGVPYLGTVYAELISGHNLPASACACARSARTRWRSTRPASRSPGCAIGRSCSPAS
jgi:simple sugar transport system permease protein